MSEQSRKPYIRRATQADIPAVQQLSLALFRDPTSAGDQYLDDTWPLDDRGRRSFESGLDPKSDGLLLIAEANGRLVGFLSGGIEAPEEYRPIKRSELYSFYVLPELRSQGIGAELTKQFLDWSRQQKAVTAFVEAYADNDRGIAFYKKMGFQPETLRLEIDL
jgi:ribosomal protein S18 acetylase RimI-like enzyme